jgi:hypothetical protein
MKDSLQEHLIRADGLKEFGVVRVLIHDNDLSRPTTSKGCIELRMASWYYVSGNRIDGGTLRVGMTNHTQFKGWENFRNEFGVIENNHTSRLYINVRPGTKHVVIRNNVVRKDDLWGINVENIEKGSDHVRKTEDVRIERNTVVSMGRTGSFLRMHGAAKDIVVTDNLYVAPNLKLDGGGSTFAVHATGGMNSFRQISGNVWPDLPGTPRQDGLNYYGSEPISSAGFQNKDEWERLPQVWNDTYQNVTLTDTYQVKIGAAKVGASLQKAA